MAAGVIRPDISPVLQIGLCLLGDRRPSGFYAIAGHHLRNEPSFHVEETPASLPKW
jgi:hypothetical protein